MKKFFSLIAVAALAVTVQAENVGLGVGAPTKILSAVAVNGAATSTVTNTVLIANATKFAIQLSSVSIAANTSNTTLTINRTVDGSNWISFGTMVLANTGTTTASCISNFTGQADVQLQFILSNGALAGVTNTVSASINQLKY